MREGLVCSRPATVVYRNPMPTGGESVSAYCDEHARVNELRRPRDHWSLAREISGDWLAIAEAWAHADLIRLTRALVAEISRELGRADARLEEASRVADKAMVKADRAPEGTAGEAEKRGG